MLMCFEFNLHRILIVNSVSQFAGLNLLSAIYPKLNLQTVWRVTIRSFSLSLSPYVSSRFCILTAMWKCLLRNRYSCDLFVNCVLMFIDWVTVSDCKIIGFILLIHHIAHEHMKKYSFVHLHRIRTQIRIWIYIHEKKKERMWKPTFRMNLNAHNLKWKWNIFG